MTMYETAVAKPPSKSCHIVIANAGISRSSTDSLRDLGDPDAAPVGLNIEITEVNINGTSYT